jgi:D-amino peptidase
MQRHDLDAVLAGLPEDAEVVVCDAHETTLNLDVRGFSRNVRLISGGDRPLQMVEGADGCDLAFFVCYHPMAGTEKAVMDHTLSVDAVFSVRLNGHLVGETGFNAAVCGAVDVPLALVTGDATLAWEVESFFGDGTVTCVVKEGRGRTCGELLPPEVTAGRLTAAARQAVEKFRAGQAPVLKLQAPFEVELVRASSGRCAAAALTPGAERTDGRTLVFHGDDLLQVTRAVKAAIHAADSAR